MIFIDIHSCYSSCTEFNGTWLLYHNAKRYDIICRYARSERSERMCPVSLGARTSCAALGADRMSALVPQKGAHTMCAQAPSKGGKDAADEGELEALDAANRGELGKLRTHRVCEGI